MKKNELVGAIRPLEVDDLPVDPRTTKQRRGSRETCPLLVLRRITLYRGIRDEDLLYYNKSSSRIPAHFATPATYINYIFTNIYQSFH